VPRVIITDQLRSYGAANGTCCPVSSTGNTALSTIVPKIPTNRPGNGNDVWAGSHPQNTPSAFLRPMVPSRHTFARGATGSRPPRIARRGVNASMSGGKSRGWLLPHKRQSRYSGLPAGPVMAWQQVNLTTPRQVIAFLSLPCPVPLKMINIDHQQP
jgi:hypothetical protein